MKMNIYTTGALNTAGEREFVAAKRVMDGYTTWKIVWIPSDIADWPTILRRIADALD